MIERLAQFAPVLVGFALSAVAGFAFLRLLPRWQFNQVAYEDAPATHQQKTGTPTMGGLCFVVALLPLGALGAPGDATRALLFVALACGGIGFIDDYLSIRRGKNLGLRARTKYLATALVAIAFLQLLDADARVPVDVILHTSSFALTVPHWFWLLLGIVAVTGTAHAMNLTDGLDGLATGVALPPLIVFAFAGIAAHVGGTYVVAALLIGGCLGFLLYNRHKAKMFMGDTGSLLLGGAIAGLAIASGQMLLLIIVCFVPVCETLSVILQVTYFKATKGRRIFKMTPIHHHFELLGWPETRVTATFWTASAIASAIGYWIAGR